MRDFPMIVLLEEQPVVSAALARALRAANPRWEVLRAGRPAEAIERVIRDEVAVLISTQTLSNRRGADLLAQARAISPETVGILLLDSPEDASLADGFAHGAAFRALPKPMHTIRLLADVAEAILENGRRLAAQQYSAHLLSQGARVPSLAATRS